MIPLFKTIVNYDKENGWSSIFNSFVKSIPEASQKAKEFFDLLALDPDIKLWNNEELINFAKSCDVSETSVIDFLSNVKTGEATLSNYQSYLQSTAKQTTTFATITQKAGSALKTISGTLLSTFANMAIMYAASVAIEAIGTAIYDTIHATEIAIEKGEEAKQVIADIGDAYNSKKNTVDTNKDRYIELSVGVNTKTNENLSLTADEYSEFLNITNQLAETFPSLVTGYDAQGNALLSLSGNADETSASLEKLLEQERQLADFKISQNLQTAFDGTMAQIGELQDEIDNTMQKISELEDVKEGLDISNKSNLTDLGFSKTDDGFEYSLDLFSINGDNESFERFTAQQNAFIQAAKDAGIEETNNMWQDINENAMDNAGQAGMSWTGHIYNITKDQLDTFTSSYKAAIKESGIDVTESLVDAYQIKSADQKEIQANWNSLVPSLITAMSVYDGYDKLGEGVKQAINSGIGNIDPIKEWLDSDGNVNTPDNVRAYLREKFLDPITDVLESDALSADQKKTFQDNINNIFSLDKTLNAQEYQTQLNTYLNNIKDMFSSEEAFNDFVLTFGLKFQTEDGEIIDSRDSLMRSISKKVLKSGDTSANRESLNELTYEQLVNVEATYTDSTNGKSLADVIEEETTKAQNTIDSTEPITFASLFASDEEGSFNKQVDQFQSNISSIDSALETLRNGEDVDLTDLVQQFPELAGQTDNLQESLSNLKAKQIGDFATKWKQFTSDLDPTEMQYAQNFMQNFLSSMDLTDVDLSKARSKILTALMPNPGELDSVGRQQVYDMVDGWIKAASTNQFSNKMAQYVQGAQNAYSNASTAMSESISGTGLSTDTISAIKSQFADLGMSNLDILFTNTAEGVKLNADALENLSKIQYKIKSQEFASSITKQRKAIEDYKSSTDSATKQTSEYKKSLSDMENELSTLQQQQSQYQALYKQQQGLYSQYNAWQEAKSTENAGDKYTNMVSGLKEAKDAWDKGLVGTDEFKRFARMISPTGSDDAANFAENYGKAKRYLTDGISGVKNFLNDLDTKGLAEFNNETKQWSYNIKDMASAAKQMGMGKEFMSAMFGRLEDYGFHNNFISSVDEGVSKVTALSSALAEEKIRLQELQETDPTNTTAIDQSEQKIQNYQRDINEVIQNMSYVSEQAVTDAQANYDAAVTGIKALDEQRKKILSSDLGETEKNSVYNQLTDQMKSLAESVGLTIDAALNVDDSELTELQNKTIELKGTVDLTNRPIISSQKLVDMGYDADPNGTATVFSSAFSNSDETKTVLVTPILPNGDVLEPESLEKYANEILETGTDSAGIGIRTFEGQDSIQQANDYAQALHLVQEAYYSTDEAQKEVLNSLKDYTAEELHAIDYTDGAYSKTSERAVEAEKAVDKLCKTYGLTSEQAQQFIDVMSDMGLLKIEPEIDTSSIDTSDLMSTIEEMSEDQVITFKAELDDGSIAEIESRKDENGTITYTANIDGVQYEVTNVTENQDGTITYTANVDGVETELTTVQNEDGTITYTVNEIPGTTVEPDKNVESTVDYGKGEQDPPEDKEAKVNYTLGEQANPQPKVALVNYSRGYQAAPEDKWATVHYRASGGALTGRVPEASGTMSAPSSTPAHAYGTAYNVINYKNAYANGKISLDHDEEALVNELGTESIVRNGRWMLLPPGMHTQSLKKGDIVLNARQTKDLMEHGKASGHARALASGTLGDGYVSSAYSSGSGYGAFQGGAANSSSSSKSPTKSNTTATKQNTSAVNTNTKAVKQSSQAFDWIRVALDRAKSKVEEIAATITDFVSSAYKSAQLQKKITAIDNEIVANQKGYSAYLEKANAVAKKYVYQDDNGNTQSLAIPSKYKKLVKNGTFSVEDMDTSTAYGKALAEAVQKYQEYYEAAQDCRRAVRELRTEQYEAFQELMNIPTEKAEKKIEKLERKLKSLTAVQSTSSMGGSAIAQLQKLTKANNPEVKKTTDALKKAQDEQAKTAASKSTAAKEKSSANKILQTAKTSTSKSGSTLSKDAKKATNTSANALKNATKKGVSSSVVSAVNSAIKKRQPISSSLLKKLKGSALKAAKDYNAKLKQEQTINKSVSSSKTVSTKGLTGQLLKDAQKYNKDAKAQASAQKTYDKAVSNYNSATSKDNAAKQKVENATLAKKNAENATTQEQRTLISAKSGQASYVYQNKFLDQQLSVAKSENSARQTALDKATKNAEDAQKKKQKQTAKIQKQATSLLKDKSVTKALNDTQKAALKAGKTVSTTGITDPAVLKKIKAYNNMVKQGTVLNTQYTIAIEAQSEAVANAAEAEAEYAEMIVENEKQKFENIQNYYNAISDYNQKLSESYAGNRNLKSAKGEDLTEKDYQDEIASRQKDRQILSDEEAALRKQLDSAVKSGKIIQGSDEWLEMASQIRDVHNEGQNLDLTIMELQDTMREEVFFQVINKALEKAEALRASLGSINDLISDEMKYDDNGKLTDFGITALAMDIKDYESYLGSMQTLLKKRNEYIKQFNNGNNDTNYSQKEFDEDMKNVTDDIRNLLSQTNDARKAIIDSIASQSKAELDAINKVIDARQTLLKKQKEYYDYDKTLKSKTKDIQLLEQQIAALDGVNDSESKARKAQLEAQLKESKDDLDDTIFEHRYDIQVSGLDDLKTELQDNYDNYVKDLNSNLDAIVGAVDTSTANINNCLNTVNDTITKLLNSFNIEGLTGEVVGIPNYASGTKNAKGGLSRINDGNGDEIVILKDGSVLMPLTKGSQVLSARETADKIAFSSLNKETPTYKIPEINMPTMSQKEPATINPVIQCPITINGNADGQDIARELNKRMPEITKQVSMGIYKDLKKNGY